MCLYKAGLLCWDCRAAEQAERIARLLALLKNEAQRLAEESRGCVFGSLPIRPARLGRTLSCVPNVEGIVLGSSHDGDGSGCGRGQWIQPSGEDRIFAGKLISIYPKDD